MKQRDIFLFWLPLFASWLLMTAEGPIVSATINRLPNEVVMLAAQGIIVSLSVTIESPIINLLATSTALVKDRASFLLVRRFTIHWMVFLTAVSIIIAYTPVFDLVVIELLNTPAEVAVWVQPGLKIMIFWSAAIAWRRFLQGILIGYGHPGKMAWGTVIRLIVSGGTAVLLGLFSQFAGVIIGTTALMAGVVAEALFATMAIRPLLKNQLSPQAPAAEGEALTYQQLFWFHLPLAGTSFMILLVQPLITSSLAKLDNPVQSLAAWPVLFQILLMTRAAAFALPEAVIALTKGTATFKPVRQFAWILATAVTLFMALLAFSRLSTFYIYTVQDMTAVVGGLVQDTLALYILFPGLTVIAMWLRGLLIHGRKTKVVNVAMFINLFVTAVILGVGVQMVLPGLPVAAAALNIAVVFEILYLARQTQRFIPIGLPFFNRIKPEPSL